jgi:threonine synthase
MAADLLCGECGTRHSADLATYRCECGGALEFSAPAPPFPVDDLRSRPASIWRYHEALRVSDPANVVTMGEGMTPLVATPRHGHDLRMKLDFTFPTGSHKDRGASVLMTNLRDMGATSVVEDSSGNAGSAIAAYAARAGMDCAVYVPHDTSPAKCAQIRVYGAELHLVDGDREATTHAVIEAAATSCYASHNWNPHFIEGLKTVAFEIAEQLHWRAPDNVVVPAGFGGIFLGLYRGFADMLRHGITDALPRLLVAQSERCCPIYDAWRAGSAVVGRYENPRPTLAEGIASTRPVRARHVMDALRETDGAVTTVSEDEIANGVDVLAREGIYVEPTSAVVVSAFDRFVEQGVVRPGDLTVSVLTGSGLKAVGKTL